MPSRPSGRVIRAAAPADVPALLELIRELAGYEREPDAVVNDETRLRAVLFRPQPAVFAHVAEEAGRIVGCAVWFLNYSTWTGRPGIYLEDLVVRADTRGGGHGRALLARLARICVERGYPRLDWAVLDWNAPALAFYHAVGGEPLTSWRPYRLSGTALSRLAQDG
jgi:GNAT superfamily N-acetyltransferase